MKYLGDIGKELTEAGPITNIAISILKITTFYGTMIGVFYVKYGEVESLFEKLPDAFGFRVDRSIYGSCETNGLNIWEVNNRERILKYTEIPKPYFISASPAVPSVMCLVVLFVR